MDQTHTSANAATTLNRSDAEAGKPGSAVGTHRAPPILVAALRAVGESLASASEKALLRAMLQWWNPQTGELWPSIATLAESTGFTQRGVQKILRRLEQMGLVRVVQASRGGRAARGKGLTNRYQLQLEGLAMKVAPKGRLPQRSSEHNSEPKNTQPRTKAPNNPEHHSDEPSIGKIQIEPPMKPRQTLQSLQRGCLDGQDTSLRATLVRCGVRGANLETLAAATGLTSQAIEAELRDIQRDGSARNPAAVLVARLSQRTGTPLKSRPPLEKSTLDVVAKLEQMRRRLRSQEGSDARPLMS